MCNGHLALLCVGRGDHQLAALDRKPDPAEGRGAIRGEMRNPGDGDQAIRAASCGHEQITAPARVMKHEMHRDQVSVGVLDPLHEVRIDQYATAKPRNSRLPGRHFRKQDRRRVGAEGQAPPTAFSFVPMHLSPWAGWTVRPTTVNSAEATAGQETGVKNNPRTVHKQKQMLSIGLKVQP